MSFLVTVIGLFIVYCICNWINNLGNNENYKNDYLTDNQNVIEDTKNNYEKSSDLSEIENEDLINILLSTKLLEENMDYFLNSYYEIEIENGISKIISTENLFENVSPQLLCLKLVHNISMIFNFYMNYSNNSNVDLENQSYKTKNLYIKICVEPEYVYIVERKGFGLIGYNIDEMACVLRETILSLIEYIKQKSKTKKYNYLDRVTKDIYKYLKTPNEAIFSFLTENKDFFEQEIESIKEIIDNSN